MANFDNINSSLSQPAAASTVNVTIVSLAGADKKEVRNGMTIEEFKTINGLNGMKVVNENGDALLNSDVITADTQLFISAPKKNGK